VPTSNPRLDGRTSSYLHAVLSKDRRSAYALVQKLIDEGEPLSKIYEALGAAQVEVGLLWEKGVITVSDEHFATGVTLECVSMAAERLKKFRRETAGFVVLCPVEGEFHNVGLRMMSELLRQDGWETELRDSGPPLSVIKEVKDRKRVDLFCFSATMPASVPRVAEAIRAVRDEPAFRSAKILVGGPAIASERVRKEVGGPGQADCVALSLPQAVEFVGSVVPRPATP